MSKILLCFFIFILPVFGANSWESKHIFNLKKDEFGRIILHEKGKDAKRFTYEFYFRWTLYDGQKVIVLSNYREFPRQHTLYFKANLNSFTQTLLSDFNRNTNNKTYLLLQMDKFDSTKKSISFMVYIKDSYKRFNIKYINPKSKDKD